MSRRLTPIDVNGTRCRRFLPAATPTPIRPQAGPAREKTVPSLSPGDPSATPYSICYSADAPCLPCLLVATFADAWNEMSPAERREYQRELADAAEHEDDVGLQALARPCCCGQHLALTQGALQ